MIISHIGLRNFKCFNDIDLSFSKLTLLTGENSSGKSSLMYGVLAPFQSQGFPFFLSPNGDYVNMGDFVEMSFNNSKSNIIGIDLTINNNNGLETYNIKTNWAFNPVNNLPILNSLIINYDFYTISLKAKSNAGYLFDMEFIMPKDKKSIKLEVDKTLLGIAESLDKVLSLSQANNKKKSRGKSIVETIRAGAEIKNVNNLDIDTLENIYDLLSSNGYVFAANRIRDLIRMFSIIDTNINFISSFRLQPERTYYQKTKTNSRLGTLGENYIDQIIEWEERNQDKFKSLKLTLNNLDLLHTMKKTQLKGGRFEFRVRVKNKGVWALLTDVGLGISQFLPILVADLQLSKYSTLMVAQPEIHLHPSVQANLAEYFVKQVTQNNKRYIIETHSEYLLNRVRLSIVKGTIDPSDVSVYFFENSFEGSKEYKIEFTKDGRILNAPEKFFKTYMMDVMEIAINA